MKNFYLLILLCLALSSYSQCPTSSIILSSQSEVNDFLVNYPECTDLDYNLTISGSDITDLSPLSNLTSVHSLEIKNNDMLTNLTGLHNVVSIDGYEQGNYDPFLISNNMVLTDISALSNMANTGIIEVIGISSNPLLINLNGLQGFNNLVTSLYISNNESLENLVGLESITETLYIEIWNNDSLLNLEGLNSIHSVSEEFYIRNNPSLLNLSGLDNLEFVGEWIIRNNSNLSSFSDLNSLSFIGGLELDNNDMLSNLNGLENVSAGNYYTFTDNDALVSLNGLNIDYEIYAIRIQGNIALSDISSLELMSFDTEYLDYNYIDINSNPLLSTCSLPSICNAISIGVSTNIEGNADGCETIYQVSSGCGFAPSNNDCMGAISLEIGETIEAYNDMATTSDEIPSCNDLDRADVWFTFNSGDMESLDILVDSGYNMQLWVGNCGSLEQVPEACAESLLENVSLTINTDYYVQVWSSFGARSPSVSTGFFNITIQDATLSNKDWEYRNVKIYPNPVQNELFISSNKRIEVIEIYNVRGQLVMKCSPLDKSSNMDVSSLKQGVYIVQVKSEYGLETYKIIK